MLHKSIALELTIVLGSIGLLGVCGCVPGPDEEYTLTLNVTGSGSTTLESGTYTYSSGDKVVIVATPDEGWEFKSWSGDEQTTNSRLLVVMDSDKTITATFTKINYSLTVSTSGQGSVDPSSGTYAYNDEVTLTATPADGWQFVKWTGGVTGTSNPVLLTITGDTTVTAVFEIPEDEYTFTVTKTGSGSVSPAGGKYTYGSFLEPTATADSGYHFVRWGGDLSGSKTTGYVYLTQDISVTALFEATASKYVLTATAGGSGEITLDPEYSDNTYSAGETVTLTAKPKTDYHFVRWTGDVTGLDTTLTVTMNSTKNITAVFEADADTYNLAATLIGKGSIVPSVGKYDKGKEVSITATAADDWYFDHWTGDVTESQASASTITLTMNSSKEINAVFKPNPQVTLETSKGNITVELNMTKAPNTVKNFLSYVSEGFYDGTDGKGATIFHRVISNFMIQGGGFTADMTQKTTHDPIAIESNNGLSNDAYTIAMARTSDPDSATSQFFINLVDNDYLNYSSSSNPGYTVFGKVISGKEVVDAIGAVATQTSGSYDDVPVDTITITKVSVVTP